MIQELNSVLSRIARRFNRWRLAIVLFLIVYAAFLLVDLGYAPIRWDETPHLVGGFLISRGQFQEYMQYAYYPPLFDVTTALTFNVIGPSVFASRLIALIFGVLSVWAVFEYAYRLYGPKQAILSSVLLATMPGFIVLCRMALIETMLVFFFSIALLLFFIWLQTNNDKLLVLSGVTLGLGFIVKYQIIIAGAVMLVSGLLMWRKNIMKKMGKIMLLAIVAVAVISPWIFFAYQQVASETLGTWLYTLQVGNEERFEYGRRFPLPIFYLIEMTYPYMDIHPISFPIYLLSLFGLGYWAWRRKPEDKFSLIWFIVVYVAFTLIANRNWRYVLPVFPILAISASDFILFIWDKMKEGLRISKQHLSKTTVTKVVAAVVFVLLLGSMVVYSLGDAHYWVGKDHVYIPVEEASQYVSENSALNEAAVVLFAGNYFSTDMVRFYLQIHDPGERELLTYPADAVDAYEPVFNGTFMIEQCIDYNVKYLLLYEHGDVTYYNSEWKSYDVLDMMLDTESFALETEFGSYPRHIYVLRFLSNS